MSNLNISAINLNLQEQLFIKQAIAALLQGFGFNQNTQVGEIYYHSVFDTTTKKLTIILSTENTKLASTTANKANFYLHKAGYSKVTEVPSIGTNHKLNGDFIYKKVVTIAPSIGKDLKNELQCMSPEEFDATFFEVFVNFPTALADEMRVLLKEMLKTGTVKLKYSLGESFVPENGSMLFLATVEGIRAIMLKYCETELYFEINFRCTDIKDKPDA